MRFQHIIRFGVMLAALGSLASGPEASAIPLTYTLSGSSITGNLGAINFANASWSMTMTADSSAVVAGQYNVGPGGIYQFPYYYLAGDPLVTITQGSTVLTAHLVPATGGNTVGLMSIQNPFAPSAIQNMFLELSPTATNPPTPTLGVSSNTLNTLDSIGSYGITQISNVTDTFNTDQGTLYVGSYSNLTGSFTVSAPVPEIDPAGLGSVLSLVLGSLSLVERRRRARLTGLA